MIGACATTSTLPAYNPQFTYTPPQEAKPGAAQVTIALVAPSYAQDAPWTGLAPWTTFSNDLSSDFNELLAARGFLVKGPFGAYEQMVFPDKQGSDLVLVPTLSVTVDLQNVSRAQTEIISGNVRMKGDAVLTGRVDFVLMESLTGTRMWTKNVPLGPKSVQWTMSQWLPKNAQFNPAVVYQDQGFVNALGPVLEGFYTDILENAWTYLNPDELKLVKTQSLPVRKRAAGA